MSVHASVFPQKFSVGSTGGPGYSTTITTMTSGSESRNARWQQARHRYDLTAAVREQSEIAELLTFFHQRGGALNGFLLTDPQDHSTHPEHIGTPDEINDAHWVSVEPAAGDGTRTVFQLVKRYNDGGNAPDRIRAITRPIDQSVKVRLGVGGAHTWSVDSASGQLTFTTPPDVGQAVEAQFEFYVPVRFSDNVDKQLLVRGDQAISEISSMPMIEVKDHIVMPEDVVHKGLTGVTQRATDFTVNGQYGKLVIVEPIADISAFLPDPTQYPAGGEHWRFMLVNPSTFSVTVRDQSNNALRVMDSSNIDCSVWRGVTVDGSFTPQWYVLG